MGKLSSILLGTVSGAALALFLTSDKGKQVCSQAQDFLDDLREDPEYAKEQVCEKLTEVRSRPQILFLKPKNRLSQVKSLWTASLLKLNHVLVKRQKHQKIDSIISRSNGKKRQKFLMNQKRLLLISKNKKFRFDETGRKLNSRKKMK